MLLHCLGTGLEKKTLVLDVDSSITVSQFKTLVIKQSGRIIVKRLLFSGNFVPFILNMHSFSTGKQLSDDKKSLFDYKVTKESTIQIFAGRELD